MIKTPKEKCGAILVMAMVALVVFTLLVSVLLQASSYNNHETEQQIREAQAFWLAEEGKEMAYAQFKKTGSGSVDGDTPDFTSGRKGSYHVTDDGEDVFTSTGTLTVGSIITTRSIQFEIVSLYAGYEDLIHAPKRGSPWTFLLGGSGSPVRNAGWPSLPTPPGPSQTERGGPDQAYGNIYLGTGSFYMNGESSINPAPAPNTHGFTGDVSVYDGTITTSNSATIAGTRATDASAQESPDLVGMNYSEIATHNLTDIFKEAEELGRVTYGRLNSDYYPFLHDLVRKDGDDYYFETTGSSSVEQLNVGDACVFYADGDVWFDKSGPLQYNINGTATIVASGDIHIGDGLTYVDNGADGDLLALIALGKYNDDDTYKENGDIYFGDGFGTLYNVDAFMFAAHDFYYNYVNEANPSEPNTGFSVLGNFVALNQLHIYRDWYGEYNDARPAVYVPGQGWKDAINWEDGTDKPLTQDQIDGTKVWVPDEDSETGAELETGTWVESPGIRHYAMIMRYDERIFDPLTQPPCLPRGGGRIVNRKIINWQHADGAN